RDRLLAYRALNLARMGSADLARTAVDDLTAKPSTHGEILYNGACVYSLSAAASSRAGDVDSFASHSVGLLTRALEGDYFKAPGPTRARGRTPRPSSPLPSRRVGTVNVARVPVRLMGRPGHHQGDRLAPPFTRCL